jgi:GT2 family glycosyltransferase
MLERCLASLAAALRDDDELVVVDSASRRAEVGDIARHHGAGVLRCERPGVDRARNAGWRATGHALVLFLDDDITVDPGWADAMVAAFTLDPHAAFVTGRIEVPAHQSGIVRPVAIKDDHDPATLDAGSEGTIGHSASLGVRRSVLEQLGGFDETLGAGARFKSAPEVDLFDRIFAAGRTGRYQPDALAWHDQWRNRGDKIRLDWRYGIGAGARVAKLLRTDRRRAARVARETLWDGGVRGALGDLRNRYELGALTKLALASGCVVGLVAAAPVPVREGHFAPPGEQSAAGARQ